MGYNFGMSTYAHVKITGMNDGEPMVAKYRADETKRAVLLPLEGGNMTIEVTPDCMRVVRRADVHYELTLTTLHPTELNLSMGGKTFTPAPVTTQMLDISFNENGFTAAATYKIADEISQINVECELDECTREHAMHFTRKKP